MRVETAVHLINDDMAFMPGWSVWAEDHSARFADTIAVHFTITEAHRSERETMAADGSFPESIPGGARAAFPINVADVHDTADLYYRVILAAVEDFTHEAREFSRSILTGHAPLHPHRADGIAAWATRAGSDPARDYLFGLV